jgi:hypothetical protein
MFNLSESWETLELPCLYSLSEKDDWIAEAR